MPIDVDTAGSPGWWLKRLSDELFRAQRVDGRLESRVQRYDRLWSYFVGNPPPPRGAENCRPLFDAFIRKSRANYAALVVEAPLNRMRFLGVRDENAGTDADGVSGDDLARRIGQANDLPLLQQDVHAWMLAMSRAYVIVGPPDESGLPVMTAEDPRQVVTAHDPTRPSRVRAGAKLYRDVDAGLDLAHVFVPGAVWVATKPAGASSGFRFSAQQWEWDDDRSGDLPLEVGVPVTRFENRYGMGEFESNLDLLDRINHTIMQRMVIATLQAFRQRALIHDETDLPDKDAAGQPIDYDALFSADPGAMWKIPSATAKLWESQQSDLQGVLSATKDDVKELAATTSTPLHLITPDAASGSAEGAALMREGLTYKVEDRRTRAGAPWLRVHRQAFLFAGDPGRAAAMMSPVWAPSERFSMAERADAAVKARSSGVPQRSVLSDVWQFSPEDVARMERERLDDALLAPVEAPPALTPA